MLFLSIFNGPSTVVHLQPTTVDTHQFSSCPRAKKMSVTYFRSNALRLASNPRALMLECWNLLYHSETIFEESGATSSNCRGNIAVQIRRWKRSSQTLRSRQLSQPLTKMRREISSRDSHSWKKKQYECEPQ